MSEVKVNKISPRTNCGTVTVGDAGDSVTVTAGVPVTVNGDLKSNALKAVDGGSIISQCGTNITLGASGDTINLAAGASQTGFGRTGTVDWDTTAKTASFTAVSGTGYFVNTTSGAITVTLPASPSAGDIVSIKDYAYTFATNNLTVARNGSPIGGGTGNNPVYATNGTVLTFIYVDGTKGWLVTNESTDTSEAVTDVFITATGGTITCCGDYKIHTFTGPGTFSVSAGEGPVAKVDYLVVAGGGAGGTGSTGGGGGGGGFRESVPSPAVWTASPLANPGGALPVSVTSYPITVGAGGSSGSSGPEDNNGTGGNSGSNSVFSTITSAGGGRGASSGVPTNNPAENGGSGGGGNGSYTNGNGNTPPVSPPQGQNGQASIDSPTGIGGGGGGATTTAAKSWVGRAGVATSISGSPSEYSGGGGGGKNSPTGIPSNSSGLGGGEGGAGGGGGGASGPSQGGAGGTNQGGGGGGGGRQVSVISTAGGNGGSGIVIIRYKYQ